MGRLVLIWVLLATFLVMLSFPVEAGSRRRSSRRRGGGGGGGGGNLHINTSHPPNPPPRTEPITNSSCVLKPRSLESREKAYLHNVCSGKHKDFPSVSILLWRPQKSSQMTTLKKAFPSAEFVVIFDGPASSANYKEWRQKLDGPNDFQLYTKAEFGEVEAFERLIKITNARHAIYLNKDFAINSNSVSWLKKTYEHLKSSKGGVFFSSKGGLSWSDASNADELGGPYIVDRESIYTKGGVGAHRWCFAKCGIAQGLLFAATTAGLKTYTESTKYSFKDKTGSCIAGLSKICDSSAECFNGYDGKPVTTTLIVQFYKRDHLVQQLVTRLKKFDAEILINNDGNTAHNSFMRHTDKRFHVLHAPNIHEIRGYNRLGQYARGKYIVLLQDDDKPKNANWLKRMFKLFQIYPAIGMIGGHRGRLDVGKQFDKTTGQNKGEKYGTPSRKGHKFHDIELKDPSTNIPMMFMYKVNAAPLVLKRDAFLELGGFNRNLSCPGEPGIGFDFEYSIRLWYNNYQVALAESEFLRSHTKAGTRANSRIWNVRRRTEIRNNQYFYTMFRNFHHAVGTKKALDANKKLKKV